MSTQSRIEEIFETEAKLMKFLEKEELVFLQQATATYEGYTI